MAPPKGNKYAQKHSKEHVVAVLTDVIDGMLRYDPKKTRNTTDGSQEEYNYTNNGYSCIERGLHANGTYKQKLTEWEKFWKDDKDVTELIKKCRIVSNDMIITNTIEGKYNSSVGIFLMKAKLGMVEKGVELEADARKSSLEVKFVPTTKDQKNAD